MARLDNTLPTVTIVPCRYDEAITEEVAYIPIKRDWHEDRFYQMLETIGCDGYGHASENSSLIVCKTRFGENDPSAHYVIDTPLFTLRPYYWGDNREILWLPNFVYKPWSLEISWYKWPMRDAHANFALKDSDWALMCETIEHACKHFEQTGDWDIDYDDFPRMTESDERDWEIRKKLDHNWFYTLSLEDLLFDLWRTSKTDDDDFSQDKLDQVRSTVATKLGLDDCDMDDTYEGDDNE